MSIRLDDEGNVRLLDEQTVNYAHSMRQLLQTFQEDLAGYSAACERSHGDARVLSKSLLSLKATAALKRAELNKETHRRSDEKQLLQEEINYANQELKKDRAYLQSLKAVEERLVQTQENLFLK